MTELMKPFSHIYVEEQALKYERTKRILQHFPGSEQILIRDYRDVFNRRNQNPGVQHRSQKLILAVKKDGFLYKGAPVCQSFGESDFYYTSNVMNCVYDCDYCFLKGMYPTSNMVIFVNLEDTFNEINKIIGRGRIYVSIPYESDMLAIEGITGMISDWAEWARGRKNVLLELRTKCANVDLMHSIIGHTEDKNETSSGDANKVDNMILAVTMSPDEVISKYEKYTPKLDSRILMAKAAIEKNMPVRLCFDPMMFIKDYKDAYGNTVDIIFSKISPESLRDVSLGSFRISKDYIKNFRKSYPDSGTAFFPYEMREGYYQYPEDIRIEMEDFLYEKLLNYLPEEKIFRWK